MKNDKDRPTYNQLNLLYKWYQWRIPTDLARDAVKWLENNATRKAVSEEIDRVHALYRDHTLNNDTCFAAPVWDGYKCKTEEA